MLEQPRQFSTTRWTIIRAARGKPTLESRQALDALCARYWYPVYELVRRSGHSADAADLTQEFFAELIDRDDLSSVDPERGRFRSWIRACVKNCLSRKREHAGAQKRGGGQAPICIDAAAADERFQLEASRSASPDLAYDRQWLFEVSRRAIEQLEKKRVGSPRAELFALLKEVLQGESELKYAEIAGRVGGSEEGVKQEAYRLRNELQKLMIADVSETVGGPEEAREELKDLLRSLEE